MYACGAPQWSLIDCLQQLYGLEDAQSQQQPESYTTTELHTQFNDAEQNKITKKKKLKNKSAAHNTYKNKILFENIVL